LDYNSHSKLFNQEKLAGLRFANQVKIFHGGFAMWKSRLQDIQPSRGHQIPGLTAQP
jgi:hypothetical protein